MFREQDRRAVAATEVVGGLGDDPEPLAPEGPIGRQQAGAVDQGLVVQEPVLLAEVAAPVAFKVSTKEDLGALAAGPDDLQGTGRGDELTGMELGSLDRLLAHAVAPI